VRKRSPPKISVKTGVSLSMIRAQTRDTIGMMSGLNRNEPTKTIASRNLNKTGNNDRNVRIKLSIE
jgi:hypothetical protein